MSKPRYDWWGYIKRILYRYPNCQRASERRAVEEAIQATKGKRDAKQRLELIRLVYWANTRYNLPGAALKLSGVSEATAKRWHGDFIREIAYSLKLVEREKPSVLNGFERCKEVR